MFEERTVRGTVCSQRIVPPTVDMADWKRRHYASTMYASLLWFQTHILQTENVPFDDLQDMVKQCHGRVHVHLAIHSSACWESSREGGKERTQSSHLHSGLLLEVPEDLPLSLAPCPCTRWRQHAPETLLCSRTQGALATSHHFTTCTIRAKHVASPKRPTNPSPEGKTDHPCFVFIGGSVVHLRLDGSMLGQRNIGLLCPLNFFCLVRGFSLNVFSAIQWRWAIALAALCFTPFGDPTE